MKNIEKYTNTKDALEAYNDIDFKNIPFGVWLDCEYEDQSFPTLLEAAECALKAFEERDEYGNLEWVKDRMRQLCVAIKREKAKPVRNCDKYKTVDEAYSAYRDMCKVSCSLCKYYYSDGSKDCAISWLYDEANKEVAE